MSGKRNKVTVTHRTDGRIRFCFDTMAGLTAGRKDSPTLNVTTRRLIADVMTVPGVVDTYVEVDGATIKRAIVVVSWNDEARAKSRLANALGRQLVGVFVRVLGPIDIEQAFWLVGRRA